METRFAIDAALGWSIRPPRGDHRGRGHVVRDPHGHPLVLPLSVTLAELQEMASDPPGRYRVEWFDEEDAHGDDDSTNVAGELRATVRSIETVVPSRSAASDAAHSSCHKSTRETDD